ncbi:hypothetical protein RI129_001792 [Pyrocoelia pectoralis]|uniref:Acyltransferase n=1 Tax=Pyrocoelia pectoralis TaxID=417401 RepID=A0AAN7VWM1_9COLE
MFIKPISNYGRRVMEKFLISGLTITLFYGIPFSIFLTAVLSFYTSFWPFVLIYVAWIFTFDRTTCEIGGRASFRLRGFHEHYFRMFPLTYETDEDVQLHPNKNYLFCCYPHGIVPYASIVLFISNVSSGFSKLFPHHSYRLVTLKQLFYIPFLREIMLESGVCSASRKSLSFLLGNNTGGNAVGLIVGGAEEALHARSGDYHIILNNRKGFIRIALENGSPIVPVFSFGANDIHKQLHNRYILAFQKVIKRLTGISPIILQGRGFFQDIFGIVPFKSPINTIVGKPIEVERLVNPTEQQVDELHQKFAEELTCLFNKYKMKYVSDPEQVNLIIH